MIDIIESMACVCYKVAGVPLGAAFDEVDKAKPQLLRHNTHFLAEVG